MASSFISIKYYRFTNFCTDLPFLVLTVMKYIPFAKLLKEIVFFKVFISAIVSIHNCSAKIFVRIISEEETAPNSK